MYCAIWPGLKMFMYRQKYTIKYAYSRARVSKGNGGYGIIIS